MQKNALFLGKKRKIVEALGALPPHPLLTSGGWGLHKQNLEIPVAIMFCFCPSFLTSNICAGHKFH